MREGHPAVTPQALTRHHERVVARERAEPSSTRPETEPERAPVHGQATLQEGVDSALIHAELEAEFDTVHEGLGAVSTEAVERDGGLPEDVATLRKQHPVSPYESGMFTLQQEERTMSWAIIGAVWVVTTAALMLSTYYLTTRAHDEPIELRADSARVRVEAGPFIKGLDEQVRAFMLMTCQKIADDSEKCEQDELLKGEYPEQTVELEAYRIDNLEVTNLAYEGCVAKKECPEIDYKNCDVYTHQGLQISLRVPKTVKESRMPAACITRAEASAYCRWVGGRLPTHDQWERAARGTEGRLFPWGDAWVSDYANWGEVDVIRNPILGKIDGYEWAAPPGSFVEGKSPADIYDMAGNVAEWVAPDDTEQAIARGGSWVSNPFELRTTGRLELEAETRRADLGFRCAYPAP